jgi:hypothetical protein
MAPQLDAAPDKRSVPQLIPGERTAMRIALGILLAFTATTAVAATDPRTLPTKLSPEWQAKSREVF